MGYRPVRLQTSDCREKTNRRARRVRGDENALRSLRSPRLVFDQNETFAPTWTRVEDPRPWATATFSRSTAAEKHAICNFHQSAVTAAILVERSTP